MILTTFITFFVYPPFTSFSIRQNTIISCYSSGNLKYSMSPSYSLTTFLFIIFFTSSHGQDDFPLYRECRDNLYSCGEAIQGIGFPFYGYNRPRNCGLAEFALSCHNEAYTTIYINEQSYRVLEINQSTSSMRVVQDQLYNNICLLSLDCSITGSVFSYRPNYENLTLLYGCSKLDDVSDRETFNCSYDNRPDTRGLLLRSPSRAEERWGCISELTKTLPVRRDGFEEFGENKTLGVTDLVNFGFDIEYRYNNSSCSACTGTGGVCWTNTTSRNGETPTCLCPNGLQQHVCTIPGKGGSRKWLKMILGFGAGALPILMLGCIFYCYVKTNILYYRKRKSPSRSPYIWKLETSIDTIVEDFIRQHGSQYPNRYTYSDVKKITNSFKDELGKGGHGSVYKGKLPDGRLVAVKILNASEGNGEEFINEVASIGRTSHINVVSLFGFCYSGEKRALIYEYMSNGSLDKFLRTRDNHLTVENLFQISLGVARGLEYLHRGCNTRILHFDIKPHNILLDKDFRPKIADFGLAKTYCGEESIVSMAETRGTIGYIAPEVFSRSFGNVSHKSDVYSYGMLLIEMVGEKSNDSAAIGIANNSSAIYFPNWIYKRLELNENSEEDGVMAFNENEIKKKMLIVGLWCIQMDPTHRPPMNKVIDMLLGSLEDLQIPPKPFFSPPQPPPVLYSFTSTSTSTSTSVESSY